MTILPFNYITDPPGDELVNEVTQLNNNWDLLENRLSWLQGKASAPPTADFDLGLEGFVANRHAVWDGANWRNPTDIESFWSAWADIPLAAAYQAVAGFTPRYRVNSVMQMVECAGRLQLGATGTPWIKTAYTQITNSASGIPAANAPVGGLHMDVCATSPIGGAAAPTTAFAMCRMQVVPSGANPVRINANWIGGDTDTTGNYLALDGLRWWY